MSNTYYSSLSGMLAASYGLQNTSNNVANMQSHGFKRNDVFYSSLGNGHGEEGFGNGVRVGGNTTNFGEGKYLETNSASDLAVVGQGFFVIRLKSNELIYTRAGDFEFKEGILIDKHTGGQVQGYDKAGNLVPIHEKGPKNSPGKASREVFIKGQFVLYEKSLEDIKSQIGPMKNKYENIIFKLEKIYDVHGTPHTISFEFESTPVPCPIDVTSSTDVKDDGKNWDLKSITCDDGTKINPIDLQHITFGSLDAGPSKEMGTIKFLLNKQEIHINFGSLDDSNNAVVLKEVGLEKESPFFKMMATQRANNTVFPSMKTDKLLTTTIMAKSSKAFMWAWLVLTTWNIILSKPRIIFSAPSLTKVFIMDALINSPLEQ